MDWQIRIAILIAGLILVGYIYWDFAKKKNTQKANEKLKRQFGNLSNQVDSSGFDLDGVGQARTASDEQILAQEETKKDNSTSGEDKQVVSGASIDDFISHKNTEHQQDTEAAKEDKSSLLESNSNADLNRAERTDGTANQPKDFFDSHSNETKIPPQPELVFSLILQSKAETKYKGNDFLPIFLSQGLRYGDMGIFHRHQKTGANPGPVLFSLANAIAPGTFNIDNIDSFQTPALTLFMALPGPGDAQIAYNAMVKTARLIITELGGVILDESQSIYSEQTHNHRLDQIQEYSRKSMS